MEFLKKYMFAISTPIALYFWFLFFQGYLNFFPCIAISVVATLSYFRLNKQ